jgi:endonuclease I
MKKILLGLSLLILISLSTKAQVAIPMPNFGFSVSGVNFPNCAIPSGFTYNVFAGGEIYNTSTSGGANFPALKLASTGHFAQIQTATAPGTITYSIRGNSSVSSWNGTFNVQQSVDGIDFSTLPVLKTYSGSAAMPITGNFVVETVTPDQSARYIRWFYTNKIANSNVALDDISIAAPAVSAGPNLVVSYNSATLINNQTINFNSAPGVTLPLTLTLSNYANTNDLNINATTAVSGNFASDYTITNTLPFSIASSVGGTNNTQLIINFTPPVIGTRDAILTISSNDLSFPSFVVNLNGIGGTIASEPVVTLSNLTFSGASNYNKSYRLKGSFTSSGAAAGYLIVKKIGSAPATLPTDGKAYLRGDTVGTDKVVGTITSTDFVANNIVASTNYYFTIYPYNGSGTFTNYGQGLALTGNVTSAASMVPANEYNSINTSNASFISDLTSVIDIPGRTKIYYSNYGGTMMKLFAATDTFAGKKVATCVYSGDKFIYSEPIAWGYFSREHSYCHNWMPTNPADGSGSAPNNVERPEYNDQHHLFPTNQDDVNAIRSNNPLGVVVTTEGSFLEGKVGLDINGNRVYEPRDAQKGRTARAIMYIAVAHNNLNDAFGNTQNWKLRNPISATIPYGQDQNVLKKWNTQFPPDNWDIARNDFLDSLQGNRNPFVDHPEYACYIDFSNMTYIANPTIPCDALGMSKLTGFSNVYVAPNPVVDEMNVFINVASKQIANISIIDITGKTVTQMTVALNAGNNQSSVSTEGLSKGVYTLKISGEQQLFTQKIIKQ